jgi:hypothetical protein
LHRRSKALSWILSPEKKERKRGGKERRKEEKESTHPHDLNNTN